MLLDSFEVENFRSLKHLKLEKLARVNLLVGKNNSGKTSVLEALYTLTGIKSDWFSVIQRERGVGEIKVDFRQLFYSFDSNNKIFIKLSWYSNDSEKVISHSVSVRMMLAQNQPQEAQIRKREQVIVRRSTESALGVEITASTLTKPINISFHGAEDGIVWLDADSISAQELMDSPLPFLKNFIGEIITTKIDRSTLSHKLEQLKVTKREAPLLRILQQVDARIQRLDLVTGGQIYLDLGDGFANLLLLNLMGEGVQRLLDISSGIAHSAGGLVFIDEIDNGLHYSVLRILWKGILQAAREYDVQVFATTHSAEALRHLTWVLDEEDGKQYRDDVAAYTLIRTEDDTVRTYRHDYEQLDYALDHGVEIRN